MNKTPEWETPEEGINGENSIGRLGKDHKK
jgi:hypothetical protein